MKLSFATAVIAMASAVAVAQTPAQKPPSAAPITPAAEATPPAAAPAVVIDPVKQKEAEALLTEVAKAYKSAKTMTDTIKLDVVTPMGPDKQELQIIIGPGNDAVMAVVGSVQFTALGEKLFVIRDEISDKFFSAKLEGDLFKTLEKITGQPSNAPLQFALRTSETTEERLTTITMGVLENPKFTGRETIKAEDGASMLQLSVAGDNGNGTWQIHPDSKLILKSHMEFNTQGFQITADMTMSPKVYDTLPTPIAFNPGDRKSVDSLEDLKPDEIPTIEVGQVPPDFTLPTLTGEMVTLSKLKGSIVVLDFWATWCPPCKKGLPLLQEFTTWAAENAKDVKVYAVDVMERTKSADDTKKKVEEFWTANKYTIPMVMDLEKKVFPKYGFDGIPVTVIIGVDGKVASIHAEGYDADMVNILKADIEKVRKGAKAAG